MSELKNRVKQPKQIKIIGAGGIIRDAHLPAYRKAGFVVSGIYDLSLEKAQELANAFGIEHVYLSLEALIAAKTDDDVFDLAVPAQFIAGILRKLPDGSAVLIQKPMGDTIEQAKEILSICKEKNIKAGVNFQLRYAPFITQARSIIQQGLIGKVNDIELRVNVDTPWHMWDFFATIPRTEILYHSIHYIDLLRSFQGDPKFVYAKTWKHPEMMEIASTRSVIIMDYDEPVRANINTNHAHKYGIEQQESFLKIEGDKGAIKIKIGVSFDYPRGVPDELTYVSLIESPTPQWKRVPVEGTWFYDAFMCCMNEFMKYVNNESGATFTSTIDDAYKTMATVEAAYISSASGGTTVDYIN